MEWFELLAWLLAIVILSLIVWLLRRYAPGIKLPEDVRKRMFGLLYNLLLAGLKNIRSPQRNMPDLPKVLAIITGAQLQQLLKPYGIKLKCPLDAEYGLPSKSDLLRFLTWYKANAPIKPSDYIEDELDCDDFAWIMRAYFLIWCRGKCAFVYIEATSADENYPFPMHGFCAGIDWNNNVYFADHLEVAASVDGLDLAYEVYCQDAKA